MPQSDPIQGATFLPLYTDSPAIPDVFAEMYSFLLNRSIPRFASTTARDAALPSPTDGMMAVTGTGASTVLWIRATTWQVAWQPPGAWAAVTLHGGFTGTVKVKNTGGFLTFQGTIAGTFPATANTVVIDAGGIPAALRPSADTFVTLGTNSTATPVVRGIVGATGGLTVITGSSAPTTVYPSTAVCPLG